MYIRRRCPADVNGTSRVFASVVRGEERVDESGAAGNWRRVITTALIISGAPFHRDDRAKGSEERETSPTFRSRPSAHGVSTTPERDAPFAFRCNALRHSRTRRHFRSSKSERRELSQQWRDVSRASTTHFVRPSPPSPPLDPSRHATFPSRVRIVRGSRGDCVYI